MELFMPEEASPQIRSLARIKWHIWGQGLPSYPLSAPRHSSENSCCVWLLFLFCIISYNTYSKTVGLAQRCLEEFQWQIMCLFLVGCRDDGVREMQMKLKRQIQKLNGFEFFYFVGRTRNVRNITCFTGLHGKQVKAKLFSNGTTIRINTVCCGDGY